MVASQGPNEGEIVEFNLIHWPRFAGDGPAPPVTLLPPPPIGAIMTPA
jgi:hypothetical protein